MDQRDLTLLQAIKAGTIVFTPDAGESDQSDSWADRVERLIRLSSQGLIRMPAPRRSMQSAHGGYLAAGPCELTADGRDALQRHGDLA